MVVSGAFVKLASLIVATVFAFRSAHLLKGGNPASRAWLIMGLGLTFFSLGQATLTWYQTRTGAAPFPSAADIWFMISYPLLILALAAFITAYVRSGFPAEGWMAIAAVVAIVATLAGWPLLQPIARTPAAPMAKALNLAYPALDLMMLVPAAVLLWLTSRFRGGAIWHIWLALIIGILATAFGDIAFAYFSTLGLTRLDPLLHAMYIVAYGSLAVSAATQHRLVAPA
jgi:hypothetical protein